MEGLTRAPWMHKVELFKSRGLHLASFKDAPPSTSPITPSFPSSPRPWIEPITEEPEDLAPERTRFHRTRAPLPRTQSAPQLIFTTTTKPFHNYTYSLSLFIADRVLYSSSMANANLMPRADSFNARVRGTSHIDFRTATTGVAAKTMRNEIGHLVATVSDPQTKRVRCSLFLFSAHPMTSVGVRHRDAGVLLPLHPLPLRARQEPGSVRVTTVIFLFLQHRGQ